MSILFCGTELGRRIEHAEAALITAAVGASTRRGADGFVLPLSGGVAAFGEPGAPFNKVVGLGFAGVPTAADIDAVERAYAAHGSPTPVELSTLADPQIAELLGAAATGWWPSRMCSAANSVTPSTTYRPGSRCARPGGRTGRLGRRGGGGVRAPGRCRGAQSRGVPARCGGARRARLRRGRRDTVCGGGRRGYRRWRQHAGHRWRRAADRCGDGTAPPASWRAGRAACRTPARRRAAGADVAVVTTSPGSLSQRNVQRRGFHLLYTRAILVKGDQ